MLLKQGEENDRFTKRFVVGNQKWFNCMERPNYRIIIIPSNFTDL